MRTLRHLWLWNRMDVYFGTANRSDSLCAMFEVESFDVFPIYSAVLARTEVENFYTQWQFTVATRPELERHRSVHVEVLRDTKKHEFGMEVATVWLPPGHVHVSHPKAALLVFETMSAALLSLGTERGWPKDRLDRASSETRELIGARHRMKATSTSGFRVTAEVVDSITKMHRAMNLPR